MRAILSVSDKIGLAEFAKGLEELGFELFSTGGTQTALAKAGAKVSSISALTRFPEILDGRVKTLHPIVYGGILAKRNKPDHLEQLKQNKIGFIDLVAVNLYPFRQTVAKDNVPLDEALENIDIGGPSMIRASAKNFEDVVVVVDPADYQFVIEKLKKRQMTFEERKRLAQKAFQHVASYDTAISEYLRDEAEFPENATLALKKRSDLRYGENPHQKAAFYSLESVRKPAAPSLVSVVQLGGPELSFNNILDLDAAMNVVLDFAEPTVAVIKHTNPCGLSSDKDLTEAYRRALSGDPVSAFGGIVAFNRIVDGTTAREVAKTHYDAMIAPGYDSEAAEILKAKKNVRLVSLAGMDKTVDHARPQMDLRFIRGGVLAQTSDLIADRELQPKVVSKRKPTPQEMRDLLFGWRAVKHIKSNAIVLAKDMTLVGMGAGQPSRVVSVQISVQKAGERCAGSVLASDAFFPFIDGPELAIKNGVTAMIEPGGSVKDEEVIKVADQHNIALLFTGYRHFRH